MIGLVILAFKGIYIRFVRPWRFSSRCVIPFVMLTCLLQVLLSLHDWLRDSDMCGYRLLDSFRAAVGACYKFFIGFVIQAFTGIYVGFVRSWRFSSRSVIPFSVFRCYHTTFVMLSCMLQVLRSLHYWLRDPDMCGYCLLDCICAAVGACYKFSVLYMIGFVIQAFTGIYAGFVRSWRFSSRSGQNVSSNFTDFLVAST